MNERMTEQEIEEFEAYAKEMGIPALFDHLGLDGLGNEISKLIAERDAAVKEREQMRESAKVIADDAYRSKAMYETAQGRFLVAEATLTRYRNALEPLVAACEAEFTSAETEHPEYGEPDHSEVAHPSSRITFGMIRAARAALDGPKEEQ